MREEREEIGSRTVVEEINVEETRLESGSTKAKIASLRWNKFSSKYRKHVASMEVEIEWRTGRRDVVEFREKMESIRGVWIH